MQPQASRESGAFEEISASIGSVTIGQIQQIVARPQIVAHLQVV